MAVVLHNDGGDGSSRRRYFYDRVTLPSLAKRAGALLLHTTNTATATTATAAAAAARKAETRRSLFLSVGSNALLASEAFLRCLQVVPLLPR